MKTIQFSDEEINALKQLMDAGVRQLGLGAAQAAAVLVQKLDAPEEVETDETVKAIKDAKKA